MNLMVSIDAHNGNILAINDTTLNTLGYRRADLIGKTVFKLYDSSSHAAVRKALKEFKKTKKIINERLFLRTKDNRIIPVILNANPVYDKKGNIIRTNSIWRDISDLVKAENELNKLNKELEQRVELRTRELEQVNKELEEFAYMTTHDLKTPLTSIKGHLNILKLESKNQTSEYFKSSIQWIEKSIESAEAKIEAVVKIAKLKEPASQLKEKINLAEIIDENIELLSSLLSKSNAKIEKDFDQSIEILANKSNFKSIIFNIIGNSIKYKRENVPLKIRIELKRAKNNILLTIEDNGLGIDLNRGKEKVFGIFGRMHNHVSGSGIGLYLVKNIINNFGGSIDVESIVNEGTKFIINLPNKSN